MPSAIIPKPIATEAGDLALAAASYASPQASIITTFGLVVAYFLARYVFGRYWPSEIIRGSLDKCKTAKSVLDDHRLGQLSERQIEIWDKLSDLKNKLCDLRDRHHEASNAGLLIFLRNLRGFYTEACTLKREVDKKVMDFERLA